VQPPPITSVAGLNSDDTSEQGWCNHCRHTGWIKTWNDLCSSSEKLPCCLSWSDYATKTCAYALATGTNGVHILAVYSSALATTCVRLRICVPPAYVPLIMYVSPPFVHFARRLLLLLCVMCVRQYLNAFVHMRAHCCQPPIRMFANH
jgi:hypothetical protein